MIKKLKRRYLITNMALLSSILLVGLAILFGLLYHSEVQSSYHVMQTMIKESDFARPPGEEPPEGAPPKGEPPEERPGSSDSTDGTDAEVTVSPLGFSYAAAGEDAAGNNGHPPDVDPPQPYWPGHDDDDRRGRDDDRDDDRDDNGWHRPPDRWDDRPPWWGGDDDDDDRDDDRDRQPEPPPWEQHDEPQEPPATDTAPVISADTAPQTAAEPEITAVAATTTTTTMIVPVEEGQYVPDALIAQVDGDGNIAAYAGNDNAEQDDQFRRVHHAMDSVRRRGAHAGTVQVGDNSYRFLYEPDDSGTYRLVLLDRTIELSTLKRLLFIFFFIALVGLCLMFLLSMLLANWTVTPVAAAWEKQKQFVADASHELKTPLAVISANTEVILANPAETVAAQEKWLGYIQSETMRMSKLITSLLSVARMDNQENRVHTEPLAMSETVKNVCLSFEPVIYERGKNLQTVIQRNVTLRTDEDNVRQLLSILLDNAVLHSLPKAEITVSLSRDAQGKIRLAVSNTAKDIPQHQLEHLFDRFYRLDKEGSPNGSGLGLSIAKSIVHQMGGTLTVTSEHSLVTFLAAFS